jgi:hypothetical protein
MDRIRTMGGRALRAFVLSAVMLAARSATAQQWAPSTPPIGGGTFSGQGVDQSTAFVGQTTSVNVFTEGADGTWSKLATLDANSVPQVPFVPGSFGVSPKVSKGVAIVGAPTTMIGGNAQQGAVYVFTRTAGVWSYSRTLFAIGGAPGDRFGTRANFGRSGAYISVWAAGANGGSGAVYVFDNTFAPVARITGSRPGNAQFGAKVLSKT